MLIQPDYCPSLVHADTPVTPAPSHGGHTSAGQGSGGGSSSSSSSGGGGGGGGYGSSTTAFSLPPLTATDLHSQLQRQQLYSPATSPTASTSHPLLASSNSASTAPSQARFSSPYLQMHSQVHAQAYQQPYAIHTYATQQHTHTSQQQHFAPSHSSRRDGGGGGWAAVVEAAATTPSLSPLPRSHHRHRALPLVAPVEPQMVAAVAAVHRLARTAVSPLRRMEVVATPSAQAARTAGSNTPTAAAAATRLHGAHSDTRRTSSRTLQWRSRRPSACALLLPLFCGTLACDSR